ncbi:MAG: glycosyltransferase family 4 protein [Bacteroidetes bacterium]|nr:glycosyltransferase family 4 protein [Bacteroidota bacterium]
MDRKFKVLNICSWYPNEFKPTLGNFVQKHAEAISLYNEVVTLSIFPDETSNEHRVVLNTRNQLEEVIIYYPKKTTGFPLNKILNFMAHRKAFKLGFNIVKEKIGFPEIVHLNIVYPLGIWAYWLKKRYGIPFIVTENSSGFHVNSDHAYPKPIMKLCQLVLRNADYLLPVSKNLKENLKQLSLSSQFEIISNVVDENLFLSKERQKEEIKRLIHISTGVDEIKNLSGILRVMNELKNNQVKVTLDIVSDGDIEYAKLLASELNLMNYVNFHSTKTTSEVAEMIQNADALLMFSNYENFPCVIAEAMMCGKPVISSNVNGIPEHVHHFNGMLVNPRDEKALESAILSFVRNEVNFNSEEIREYAMDNFSYSEVGRKFTEIYAKVLGSIKG